MRRRAQERQGGQRQVDAQVAALGGPQALGQGKDLLEQRHDLGQAQEPGVPQRREEAQQQQRRRRGPGPQGRAELVERPGDERHRPALVLLRHPRDPRSVDGGLQRQVLGAVDDGLHEEIAMQLHIVLQGSNKAPDLRQHLLVVIPKGDDQAPDALTVGLLLLRCHCRLILRLVALGLVGVGGEAHRCRSPAPALSLRRRSIAAAAPA
mmetsp:Transcript_20785/g.65606  ORF Transcript_20785/g.65606 Transcript_20785/m.65606 type:complete len:208 (-) Transcript_20785:25-648(-)